jgi:hypothetical protein
VKLCVKLKGENWLCPLLQQAYIYLNKNQDSFRAKFHSMEVWDGDELIAGSFFFLHSDSLERFSFYLFILPFFFPLRAYSLGELGYVVGGIYTSLSGGCIRDSAGTTQLCLTGILLEKLNFLWWDFEMSHEYKLKLGTLE